MRAISWLLIAVIIFLITVCSNNTNSNKTGTEASDPELIDPNKWIDVGNDLNSGFGNTYTRYSRSKPPNGNINRDISLTGWKGEKINCQLLFWSSSDEGIVRVKSENNENQNLLTDSDINIRTVKYVLADGFFNGCGYRDKDTTASCLMPDMLDDTNTFGMPGMQTRPVWISINIPADTKAGIYDILIKGISDNDTASHSINLEVQDKVLPPPGDWSFHLDLWQNPFAVARYNDVQLWSQEHMDLLRPLLSMLAGAGQKCITTTITEKPWGGQTYDPFGSMITWIKNSNGLWEYDYSVFDQYINLAIDCGIDEQINCYSMVPWGNKFTWFDEDSAKFLTVEAKPGSSEYNEIWIPFLNNFRVHLMERGWLDKVSIALDERSEEEIKKMFAFLKQSAPDYRVTMAGHYYEDINSLIYNFSYNWGHISPQTRELIKERNESGKISTYYVACGVPKPNTFTFSPPAEASYLGWFAAAMGFDGFLRWAYNSWPENPVYDSRFIKWPSGDTYLAYPGARSSIRFEKLIEGIQDYEKIKILKEQLSLNPSLEAAEAEIRISRFLSSINPSSLDSLPAHEIVNNGRQMLDEISRIK
ncbi:MAG: DUF4091 domain-containing protein [Bacteroidota bacterium]|nr:DUF4091 domain-containing protein [Bacteroidota bacterium]